MSFYSPSDSTCLSMHEWASLKTELIWIYDRVVAPDFLQWKGVGGGFGGYRAWLIRKGSVEIKTRSQSFTVGAGKWVVPARKASEVTFSKNAHILSIRFVCQWPSGENILVEKEGLVFRADKYPALEKKVKTLERSLRQQFPERREGDHVYSNQSSRYGDFLSFQAGFLEWLALWFQVEMENGAQLTRLNSGDSRPFQAARILNLAPMDQRFPGPQLQQATGLGLMRLNQLFFSEFGLTTRKYWDRRKLEFAKQCLETSRMQIKEISYRLGFRSDSHFVIWFRRLAGLGPGEYRKNYLSVLLS